VCWIDCTIHSNIWEPNYRPGADISDDGGCQSGLFCTPTTEADCDVDEMGLNRRLLYD